MDHGAVLRGLVADLRIGISFCTRVPLASGMPIKDGDLARAGWAMPIAGLLVGVIGAAIYWLAFRLGVGAQPAAMLAVAATVVATGAIHEDGLADTADGFGGGGTRERKLEIMRDSRIGTYGACALATSLILRWSALAAIAEPHLVAVALVVAHVSARAPLPALMRLVPPARPEGLASRAGRPPPESVAAAAALGTACLLIGLGPAAAVIGVLLLSLATMLLGWLALRQIGGQTGDVLGTLEQTGEIAILLLASSVLQVPLGP
jgi:adenosylcobinamide-GDP ribazoletransferase